MILSKCAACGSKKSKFIKKQEASGISSSVSIITPLSKIPILGNIFFLSATSLNAIPLNAIPLKNAKNSV